MSTRELTTSVSVEALLQQIRQLPVDQLNLFLTSLPALSSELIPDHALVPFYQEQEAEEKLFGDLHQSIRDFLRAFQTLAVRQLTAQGVFTILRQLPEMERVKLLALIEQRTEWAVRSATAEHWMKQIAEEHQKAYDEDVQELISLYQHALRSKAGPKKDRRRIGILALAAVLKERGHEWKDVLSVLKEMPWATQTVSRIKRSKTLMEKVSAERKAPEFLAELTRLREVVDQAAEVENIAE